MGTIWDARRLSVMAPGMYMLKPSRAPVVPGDALLESYFQYVVPRLQSAVVPFHGSDEDRLLSQADLAEVAFRLGIQFGEPDTVPENRKVAYADKVGLVESILAKYLPPPVTKQQKGAVHGNVPWEEAEVMCKESAVPEIQPFRAASLQEN